MRRAQESATTKDNTSQSLHCLLCYLWLGVCLSGLCFTPESSKSRTFSHTTGFGKVHLRTGSKSLRLMTGCYLNMDFR
jgi:hypothetical protein